VTPCPVLLKEVLRPAAHAADEAHGISAEVQTQASELGLIYYAVPESLGGAATEDSLVTQMLALEDLGHGDFSLAAAIYAPVSVANVLTRYGTDAQQRQYLPAFIDETKPAIAALACNEPSVVFDPYKLQTTARAEGDSYVLNGEKSLVLLAADSELFIISAQLDGQPALFIVESWPNRPNRFLKSLLWVLKPQNCTFTSEKCTYAKSQLAD